jgi:alkylation response protein AidB-like acyl-CoA dehydrogenase
MMPLILSAEEEALRESIRHFVNDHSPVSRLRALIDSGAAYHADVWDLISAQLGLPGLVIPDELGGTGPSYAALSIALVELGAGLVASPLLSDVAAASVLLRLGGGAPAEADLLAEIASGKRAAALTSVAATSVHAADDELTGEVEPVVNGEQADTLIVPAVTADGPRVYAVARDAAGVGVTPLACIDHSRSVAKISFAGTPARRLEGDATSALRFAAAAANLALASEQLGGMTACLRMSSEYAKLRMAFGLPIGAFQGIKHRLANMYTAWELASVAVRDAAVAADERPEDFPLAAATARVMLSDAYLDASTATIQIHGGIGFTWEHDAHFYYKNAISQRSLFGSPWQHLDTIAALAPR